MLSLSITELTDVVQYQLVAHRPAGFVDQRADPVPEAVVEHGVMERRERAGNPNGY